MKFYSFIALVTIVLLFWPNLNDCDEIDDKLRPENIEKAWNDYLISFNKTYLNETEANLR